MKKGKVTSRVAKRTRSSAARPSGLWSKRQSLSRRRQEVTIPLNLTGIHPASLGDVLADVQAASVAELRRTYEISPSVVQVMQSDNDLSGVSPIISRVGASDCERRHERREVLAATGRLGGNHKPTPTSDLWKEGC